MNIKVHKLKVIIPVKNPDIKDERLATLSAVFGPKGIKAIEIIKKFDIEIEGIYLPDTPVSVKVDVFVSIKSKKTEDYKMYIGTPSVSYFVKKALNLEKFSQKPGKQIIKTVDQNFVNEIYSKKYALDDNSILKQGRIKSIIGSLKSMGIEFKNNN